MKKIHIILILIFFCPFFNTKADNYRVYLKDKGPEQFTKDSELYRATLNSLPLATLERRGKVLPQDALISIADVPLYEPYLIAIESLGARIMYTLKWQNYCIVSTDSAIAIDIAKLEFVKKVEPASSKFLRMKFDDEPMNTKSDEFDILEHIKIDKIARGGLDYGFSFTQIKLINADKLHELGIFGDNVRIGFLDSGFDYSKAVAFKDIQVAAEWDFINNDDYTDNEPDEHPNQFHHGTLVLSLVGGFDSPKFIGMSPNSQFYLAKTEDIRTERQIETDNFAAGIEWLESLGVDIINASLGYNAFDSTDASYTFDDLDGSSTLPSLYANLAAELGVVFVTSVGNGGPDDKTLNSPADADSVIAVGSVKPNGIEVSRFSARGPNSKNKLKPEIATIGDNVFCVNPTSATEYITSKGTSLSSPLIAGAIGLMISTFPEIKPYTAKKLIMESGNRFHEPDNTFGYGIPNIYQAMMTYDIIISPYSTFLSNRYQRIFFKAVTDEPIESVQIFAEISGDGQYERFGVKVTDIVNQYVCDIPIGAVKTGVINFFIEVKSKSRKRRAPFSPNSFYTIHLGDTAYVRNFEQRDEPKFVETSSSFVYPNMVYSGTHNLRANIFIAREGNLTIRLLDMTGQLYSDNKVLNVIPGIQEYSVNVSELQSGSYFLLVTHSGKSEVIPFIIVK